MKNVKLLFGVAAVALVLAAGCLLAFLFIPEKEVEGPTEDESTKVVIVDDLEKVAETEVKRFKEVYGLEITQDEMLKQLKIRKEYEEEYGKSYDLEDVFCVNVSVEEAEGDPGDESQSDIVEKIQLYVKKYNIDESRYASMTAEEELLALEVEYGPIEEDIDFTGEHTSNHAAESATDDDVLGDSGAVTEPDNTQESGNDEEM